MVKPDPVRLFDTMRARPFGVALLMLLFSILFALPAWIRFPFATNDGYSHELFLTYFADAFREGHFYPRWLHGMHAECGDATFYFYPPLTYFISLPFYFLTGENAAFAFTLALVPLTFAAGMAMYRYLREFTAAGPALAGAALSLFLPVHQTSYYLGGVMSEFAAYIFVPLILLALRRIFRREYRYALLLAGSASLLFFTSVSMSMVIAMFLPLYAVYEWSVTRPSGKALLRVGAVLAGAGVLAALLSAAMLVPFATLTDTVHIGERFDDPADALTKLPSPLWLLCLYLSFALPTYLYFQTPRRKLSPEHRRFAGFLMLVGLYVLFFCLPLSLPLWHHFPLLRALQTPSRLVFFLPFLWGPLAAMYAASPHPRKLNNIITISLICMFFPYLISTEDNPMHQLMRAYSVRPYHEFLPKQVDIERWQTVHAVKESGAQCRRQVQALKGSASVGVVYWNSYDFTLDFRSEKGAVLRIGRFYFPHWKVTEGRADISPEPGSGQMLLTVPPGDQHLMVTFRQPGSVTAGNFVSLLSWLALMPLLWRYRSFWRP